MSGVTAVAATSLYGIISGVLVPLLLFPAFIPYALSVVLVPAVSGAVASKNKETERTDSSVTPIIRFDRHFCSDRFFHSRTGDGRKIISCYRRSILYDVTCPRFFLLLYSRPALFDFTSDWGCKGRDDELRIRRHCETGVMFILASQPGLQVTGAVLAIGFGVLITSFLHIATLRKNKATATGFTMFALPYASFIMTCYYAADFHPNWGFWIIYGMCNHKSFSCS